MGAQHSTSQTMYQISSPFARRRHKTSKIPPEPNNNTTVTERIGLNGNSEFLVANSNDCYNSKVCNDTGEYCITHSTDNDLSAPRESTQLLVESDSTANPPLMVQIIPEKATRLHIKVFDPKIASVENSNAEFRRARHPQYCIEYRERPFGIRVKRKTTGYCMFDSCIGTLKYAAGRLSISTVLTSRYMYGLSADQNTLLIDPSSSLSIENQSATYSPFFVALEEDGNSHGLFLCSSPTPEISIHQGQPGSLTYHCCSGFLDLYIFSGNSPIEVIQQYQDVVGRSHIPPYWALGFHHGMRGVQSNVALMDMIEKRRNSLIPCESQWIHIDAAGEMKSSKARACLSATVRSLHENGQKYVPVIVVDGTGTGVCTCACQYWLNMLHHLHGEIAFDGFCLEIKKDIVTQSSTKLVSEFRHQELSCSQSTCCLGCNNNVAQKSTRQSPTSDQKLECNRMHEGGDGKRVLVMCTDSNWGSDGNCATSVKHVSTFTDLRHCISVVLVSNLLGISLVGTDRVDFYPDELFIRWLQVAAFFPFLKDLCTHFPAMSGLRDERVNMRDIVRDVIRTRYSLLPYLYTLMYENHTMGTPVVRPLLLMYPKDKSTYSIDDQYMWGSSLLFSPCLSQGASSVTCYFPFDIWYDFYTGWRLTKVGARIKLPAHLDHTNIHVRGGSILITQSPTLNTCSRHSMPFGLLAALDSNHAAKGKLYWDDGETLNAIEEGRYNLVKLNINKSCLTTKVERCGYPHCSMQLKLIQVFGLFMSPEKVTVNGLSQPFLFTDQKVLQLNKMEINLLKPLVIEW